MILEPFDLRWPGLRLHGLHNLSAAEKRPTLVFLHYFGGAARTWEPVLQALGEDFGCVAVDLPGSGESRLERVDDRCFVGSLLDATASAVGSLLGKVGAGDYVLVGHSMGGKVALALAASPGCPRGLRALALVAPSPPTPEPMPEAERARLLAGQGSREAARGTLEKITAKPLPEAWQAMAVEDQVRVTPAAWRSWLEYGSRVDIAGRMERIKAPVFLLAGGEDANLTPRVLRREIADRLPEEFAREPEVVPGAAHLLPLEAPEAVADFVRRAAGHFL